MKTILMTWGCCLTLCAEAAVLRVPQNHPTIQAAIQAARNGDTIQVASGRYEERLTIAKSVTITGALNGGTVIHSHSNDPDTPLVAIEGPATVTLQHLELCGGIPVGALFWNDSPRGLLSVNADVTLSDVTINLFRNYMVTIVGGAFTGRDIRLGTRTDWQGQCDIGFRLLGCHALLERITQESGWIDHTIDINNRRDPNFERLPEAALADVAVIDSRIRASVLHWGDCVRASSHTRLWVEDCVFYREPGGRAMRPNSPPHTGISFSPPNVQATLRNNRIERLPVGILGSGIFPDSAVIIEHNTFIGCEDSAVRLGALAHEIVDLGGGPLGSEGGNVFSQSAQYDVRLTHAANPNFQLSNVHALNNRWSHSNREWYIYDRLDAPGLGRVITTTGYDFGAYWNRQPRFANTLPFTTYTIPFPRPFPFPQPPL